jgi:hypothetical protein
LLSVLLGIRHRGWRGLAVRHGAVGLRRCDDPGLTAPYL